MLRQFFVFLLSNVKHKLIILTTLILVFVIAIIETFIYLVAIPREAHYAVEYNRQEVLAISERLEDTVSLYNLLTSALTMDSEVQQTLKTGYSNGMEEILQNFKLERIVSLKNIISPDKFLNVFIYDTTKLRYRMNLSNDFDTTFLKLNKGIYNAEGGIVWKAENGNMYIHRAIRDVGSLKVIGYITLMVESKYLKSRIQTATNRYTYVYDESEQPVVQNLPDIKANSFYILDQSKRIKKGVPTDITLPSSEHMLLTTYKSNSLWRVSSLVSIQELTQSTRDIGYHIIEIGLAGILLGILFIWISSSFLFRPLKDLIHAMNRFEQDNFSLRVDIKRRDEFGFVGRSFNKMMDKINYLVSEVYQKEISQKEAEYKALKAQINPHFLYNTLETIRLLSSFGNNADAEKATVALARLLKTSIDKKKDIITVREELDIIRSYLTIQNMRFQDKVEVSVTIDESMMDHTLPRFILQPIIENAFQHGLENKLGEGRLYINGFLLENALKFQVIDDGVGMSEKMLQSLLSEDRISESDKSGTGNGILNVQKRIRLLCGESYGLTVNSSPNFGTIVDILLPRGT
ncbi:sensor histidine kinase [Paenibacillus frigoriresistens]|uniref:sensor histidine kinase n=1 Tax=Paenibacillus alginolyticus TaxID=59839 RepID=UPI0015657944|nr:sensor histidine kinase [Paenibacillus frigoriresistens]NRF90365.1 sensor histidine kinase [Paenibacillus frigoriresistens]